MRIRLMEPGDLEAALALYEGARRFMASEGNAVQWAGGYPQPELIEQDVARRQAYVCEKNGHIYAAFVLALGDEPTYRVIKGAWKNNRPYGTLHRVASTGERRGMADVIVRWAFEKIRNLRGDTHALNLPMQRAFERNGFERCGVIWVADGTPRIAYQKTDNSGEAHICGG
ncbi:MAG: GNAT family N-acetyltransferase [Clostridiales bacterium]|nr:GNAT family N-acetyltransferase [Clostridiales bacterium]